MKNKRTIRQKILLYILLVFAIFYVISVGYITVNSRQAILNETLQKTELLAENAASEIGKFFERNITLTRTLSQAFTVYKSMPSEQWTKLFLEMYMPVLKANPHIYIIWDSWEYYGYVPGYTKDYGRILMYVLRDDNNKFNSEIEERSLEGDPELYGAFKKANVDDIWEPYLDVVEDNKREARLMTTIASPIQIDKKFMGLIGVDVELTALQHLVQGVKTVNGGFAFLLSNAGVIAGHPDGQYINKNVSDIFPDDVNRELVIDKVKKGEEFSFMRIDSQGESHYMIFAPVKVDGVEKPWSLAISIPYKEIMRTANKMLYISLFVGLFALGVVVILLIIISNNLTRPIVNITDSLKRMANGEISKKMILNVSSKDEIEEMAQAFNRSIEGLNQKTSFALDIGNGKLDSKLELLSESDILGKSLIDMRDSLKVAKDDEVKRKEEDKKRAWANEGFAMFADILRRNNDNLQNLADEIVKNLVKYVNANQAALFIINDDDKNDKFFELVAAYAWDRKKFVSKRLEIQEGLVGACALEKETIQLTEVPDDYVEITSGLGKATPKYIVLVPLKHEEEVLGVIEMASFTKLEQFEVDFLERVAQSIASTILTVRVNAKTLYLLEQSQQQAEEMLAQEEEVRQNMEELQATNEQLEQLKVNVEQQQRMLIALLNEIPEKVFLKDDKGKYLIANRLVADHFRKTIDEVIGKTDFDFLPADEAQSIQHKEQEIVRSGVSRITEEGDASTNEGRVTKSLLKPLYIEHLGITGLLGVEFDITDIRRQEYQAKMMTQELTEKQEELVKTTESLLKESALMNALMNNIPDSIYFKDLESRFIRTSRRMIVKHGVDDDNYLIGKSDFDFFGEDHARPAFEDEQEIIRTGIPIIDKIERETYTDGRADTYVSTTKMPLKDQDGKTIGTFGISRDVSRVMELDKKSKQVMAEFKVINKVLTGIADSTPILVYSISEGLITEIKGAGLKLLGLSDDQVVNNVFIEVFPDALSLFEKGFDEMGEFEQKGGAGSKSWEMKHFIYKEEQSKGYVGYAFRKGII
ncbi:MAG: PAS domain-containing protein [Tenuifilaceae bacterium]|jgi:PAS domain S-box-containing protein|nr:PAS domain-containing protein [Tenuifilaceae bacterium]